VLWGVGFAGAVEGVKERRDKVKQATRVREMIRRRILELMVWWFQESVVIE